MKNEEGFLVKEKRIRKDRRHNEKHVFDDDGEYHRRQSHRGHSKYRPVEDYEVDLDDDTPYAEDIQYILKHIK